MSAIQEFAQAHNWRKNLANPLALQSVQNSLGRSDKGEKVFFSPNDRQAHTHIIGASGYGKSKLLELIIRQDILNNKAGLCLIDPHGSLYEEVLLYASHHYPFLAERFVLFNPAGEEKHCLGFNPIPSTEHFFYALVMLVQSCLKVWGQDNSKDTPRIRRWLYNIFFPVVANDLSLLETEPFTTMDSKRERAILLRKVNDFGEKRVLNDWLEFEKAAPREKRETLEGAANRLSLFLQNPIIRQILGASKRLNLPKVMAEGKILLINLNGGGKISDDDKQLLGTMLVTEIFRLAKLRDPQDQNLKPFNLYIDEFAQFVTKDVARALDECRKYKLFLTLAHQTLAQLKEEEPYLFYSVLTNCKNKVVFGGLCYEDADLMAKELQTGFLDLKTVKQETERTYFRPVQEFIEVVSRTRGKTTGTSFTSKQDYNSSSGGSQGNSSQHSRSESNNRSANKRSDRLDIKYSGEGHGTATQSGDSHSSNNNWQSGESHGTAETTNESVQESETVSVQPHTCHVEEKEISSRELWPLQELFHLAIGKMKNLRVGQAIIKLGPNPPVLTQIRQVEETFFHPRLSLKFLAAFKEKVFANNPDSYTPLALLKKELAERFKNLFEERKLLFVREPLLAGDSEEKSNPFN